MAGKLVSKNLIEVKNNIKKSLAISGRKQNVTIVAVTKKQSLDKIYECIESQILDFGENYLQESLEKMNSISNSEIRWHFIGSVQSKKVKSMLGKFYLWHAVDRLSVLEELSQRAPLQKQNILIQVNIADEDTKSGVSAQDLPGFLEKASTLKGFSILGLMTMPPLFESEEISRQYFKKMRELLEKCKKMIDTRVHPMNELSMGTSQDYNWAVQEGATIIRLGEVLVGPRESL